MKNETNKRAQRTPAEIIAETEAKLERLRMKEAKQAAQNPTLHSLLSSSRRPMFRRRFERLRRFSVQWSSIC
jgi:hypothetical protein